MESLQLLFSASLLLVSITVLHFVRRHQQQQKHAHLPPGPPGSPHARYSPRLIHSWIKEYGSVISLRRGNDVLVIVGRHNEAAQLMEKHGSCFADRPHSVAGSDILGRGMRFMLLSTCDRLRRFRKAAHSNLQPRAALAYDAYQTTFARNIVINLLDDPESHQLHVKQFSASVMLRVIYGKTTPVSMTEDPFLLHLQRMVPVVQGALLPGTYIVDHFPFLRYIPWYGRQLKKYGEDEYQMLTRYMSEYKSQMMTERGPHSVAKEIITRTAMEGNLNEPEAAYFLGSLAGAAFDTVAISNILIAAALFTEAQAVVHAQLDAVVGRDTAPTFMEWASLTELQAFILEALRWRPVNPFGAPHRASKDVFWNGYHIPAGATVFGNHWCIARDPDIFPNPEEFIPGRWLGPDGNINKELKAYSFGFGRRTCVGSNLAMRSLYIASATVFWAFKISEDAKRPIDDTAFVPGIVSHPKPFSLMFSPRMDVAHLRKAMESPGMTS